MVRSKAVFGFLPVFGLLLFATVAGAQSQQAPAGRDETTADLLRTYMSLSPKAASTRLTSCEVCAQLKCTIVRVRGVCSLDKAVAALRRRRARLEQASRRVPQRLHRRDRAVTKGDFRELAGKLPDSPGRARVEPKHSPQGGGAMASRLLDLYEKGGRLSVRQHRAPAPTAQPFRPLELSDETQDGDDGDTAADKNEERP